MSKRVLPRQPELVTTPSYTLPLDVVEGALARLGWVCLAMAASVAGIYAMGRVIGQGWIDPAQAPLSYRVSMWMNMALSLGMWGLIRSRRLSPHFLLDVSLVYEVITALFIALAENAVPRVEGEVVRGTSSVAVWIVLFALAVPASFGKALLAALATACMGPLGLGMQILFGNVPMPSAPMWVVLFSTNFLLAAGSAILGKLIYHLSTQVEEARQMGSYQLVERLGSGGMGEVWLAKHRMLARKAAIKLIRADAMGRHRHQAGAAVKRFEREAEAIASLHSPHTVSLYDYGMTDDGRFYFVMELLNGLDLESLVQRHGPVPAARVSRILEQVCDSLAEAHARGLIHRDIKPRNILLCRLGFSFDFVKVLDFGLVKFHDSDSTGLTAEGQAAGTPAFIAPEAALGRTDVDHKADIYGIGCVAYWLLTGQLVFPESTSAAMMVAHVQQTPVPPSQRTDNPVPACLEAIILDCLEKEPARRPASVIELARQLRACPIDPPWTDEKAQDWWRLHLPDGVMPGRP
jgi:serine/threonine-protein kinase